MNAPRGVLRVAVRASLLLAFTERFSAHAPNALSTIGATNKYCLDT
jgi:hypothetical protein